jgi:hypothetical protein
VKIYEREVILSFFNVCHCLIPEDVGIGGIKDGLTKYNH